MSSLPLFVRTLRGVLPALAVALMLGGCDSSSRVENYEPKRMMSFGDELSLIKSDGSKHSINAFTSGTTTPDCTLNRIWNQSLALNLGLTLPGCPVSPATPSNGVMAAQAGARMAAIKAQVDARPASDFVPSTLVTIQGGMWDVLEAYDAYKNAGNRQPAYDLMVTRANEFAALVNQIIRNGEGARVIYATVHDLGLTPYAKKEQAAAACAAAASGCEAFLTDLTRWFNSIVRIGVVDQVRYGDGVINDGRFVARVLFDTLTQNIANPPRNANGSLKVDYGVTEVSTAACLTAARGDDISACTTATLVTGAASSGAAYLWASDLLPGPTWHVHTGNQAITFARNNPF